MVEHISFACNKLEEIDSEIFEGLNMLKFVNFNSNVNIDMCYDADVAGSNSLEDIKDEIKLKCKPRSAISDSVQCAEQKQEKKKLTVQENSEKMQKLMTENEQIKAELEALKISKQKQETLVENQRMNLTILLAKQSRQDKNQIGNFKSKLLKQETLINNQRENISSLLASKHKDTILINLKKVVYDSAFKDFTINVGESSFKIHKLLFAACSSTLAEIFKKNPEAEELNLHDIPESTFRAVYNFIYNKQLPDDVNYLELFAVAAKLKINDLMKLVSTQLLTNVDEKNAFEILIIANKFDENDLRKKAFEIIQEKIFPDRKLSENLAKQTEKLKKLIDAAEALNELKRQLDQTFEELSNHDETQAEQN